MTAHAPEAVAARRKELGAFYTPPIMATQLVRWALRAPSDRVLDPSFGGLAFLVPVYDRLRALGASREQARSQIFGAELDTLAHGAALRDKRVGAGEHRLLCGDFLSFEPDRELPIVDVVVGNPPYVRYQGFNGNGTRGHDVAERAGVRLTRLASSWAPFLVHGATFVRAGGRMAQVLPAEILHAQYAEGVLRFLRESFASVTLVLFEQRVFPGALEEVVLLLAEDRGGAPATDVEVLEYPNLDTFDVDRVVTRSSATGDKPSRPRQSLLAKLLPIAAQTLYDELAHRQDVRPLGEIASVDIGAVTGANDFFLVRGDDSRVPARFLRPTVSKAAHVRGARLTASDLDELAAAGKPLHMVVVDPAHPSDDLADLQRYLRRGRREGIHKRYKCRVRKPWWAVPLPKHGAPDALMTYCASDHPRVVVVDDEATVLHTNTVHGVMMRNGVHAAALAAGFNNSLTLLSAELVGRSYGGGVLKLEPTEAEAVLVPQLPTGLEKRLPEVDALVRGGDIHRVLDMVDALVLGDSGLALAGAEIALLRKAGDKLRARRRARGKSPRALAD